MIWENHRDILVALLLKLGLLQGKYVQEVRAVSGEKKEVTAEDPRSLAAYVFFQQLHVISKDCLMIVMNLRFCVHLETTNF